MELRVQERAPVVRRARAYFAAVDRVTGVPQIFDAAALGLFALDAPPEPWVDLGWVTGFTRTSGTKVEAIRTGAPAAVQMQVRTEVDAIVAMAFDTWGKLQMAVSAGTQPMNLLQVADGAAAAGSGGTAVAAVGLVGGSTARVLQTAADTDAGLPFAPGDVVCVDVDYAGETGYLGAGVSGAYVRTALTDVDYVRRVSLNVARVSMMEGGVLTLETALPAGVPSDAMKVSKVVGFCDREGSSFFQEWSGVFVLEGQQGERVVLHYPRLQTAHGVGESAVSAEGFETVRLAGVFRALPVVDAVDGERVVCFRSFVG